MAEMIIIGSKVIRPLFILGSLMIATVILVCYGLAVHSNHVHAWPIPWISQCGVHSPEKFIFTLGLVPGGVLLLISSLIIYVMDQEWTLSRATLVKGIISSIGMMVLATVNMGEKRGPQLVVHTGNPAL